MVISHVTKRFRWRYDACFQFVVRRKEGMKRNPSFVEQLKQCVLQPPPPSPTRSPPPEMQPQVRKAAASGRVAAAAACNHVHAAAPAIAAAFLHRTTFCPTCASSPGESSGLRWLGALPLPSISNPFIIIMIIVLIIVCDV